MAHLPLWGLGELSSADCDRVVKELSDIGAKEATIGHSDIETIHSTRKTKVRFAEHSYWLSNVLEDVAKDANKVCGWDYLVDSKESVQFAEYSVGHHYTWHTDTFTLCGLPQDRKLTAVVLLNDDFEGGDFEMRLYSDYKAPLKKGSIIAFPSILEHRVTEVTKGKRYSATLWLYGPRFR